MGEDKKVCAYSRPAAGDAGRTGQWRVVRPVVDPEKCLPLKKKKKTCFICWLVCPDAVIKRGEGPEIDLVYCKGCGICAEECPAGAIRMEDEEEA